MQYTHIPEISCFYSESVTPALTAPDAHFEYQIILVTDGFASVTINGNTYPLQAHSIVFISCLESHFFTFADHPYQRYVVSISSHMLTVHVQESELLSIFFQRPEHFIPVLSLDLTTFDHLLPLFKNLADEYRQKQSFFVSQSAALISSILITLYRTYPHAFPFQVHTPASDAVLNVQRYISEHYSEHITLPAMAERNYITAHMLSLAFKKFTGVSFKDYLILFRMMEAKKFLVTTALSITEIAEHVGYINVNNFIRVFRSREGITPAQYRKQTIF